MQWSDIPRNPPPKQLRTFAVLLVVALVVYQIWHARSLWDRPFVWLVWEIATWYGVAGVVWPQIMRPIFVGWLMLVFPLGWLVAHVFLAVLFFGVFTPLGLAFRLFGRDALARRRTGGEDSYWQTKPAPAGLASYFRQF